MLWGNMVSLDIKILSAYTLTTLGGNTTPIPPLCGIFLLITMRAILSLQKNQGQFCQISTVQLSHPIFSSACLLLTAITTYDGNHYIHRVTAITNVVGLSPFPQLQPSPLQWRPHPPTSPPPTSSDLTIVRFHYHHHHRPHP